MILPGIMLNEQTQMDMLQESHEEPDRSVEEDLSSKDAPIKVNRNKNNKRTRGSPDVDIEVNKDADTVNEQLDTNSTGLETEPTHSDRPDATSRERAASPALTGQTWRSSNSDASYVSALQSPTGMLLFCARCKI